MIGSWPMAQVWKLATAAAGVTALSLAVALLFAQHQHHKDEKKIAAQVLAIDTLGDNLDQCRANVLSLEGAVKQRNAEIDRQAAESKKRLETAQSALKDAQAATLAAERRIGVLMRPLVGADSCSRMIEMDDRIMEDLK